MDQHTQTRRDSQVAYWRSPEARRKHVRLLPPMTDTQKREYKNLRRSGAGRDESIRAILGKGAA